MNVGPVPGGPAADRPARLGQNSALPPLVDRDAGDTEPASDLGQTHGLTFVHEKECIESLDRTPACTDNQYMTNTGTSANYILTAPCGCTFQGRVYDVRGCTVVSQETHTARQIMRHAMASKKRATRQPSTDELFDVIERSERAAGSL